MIIIISILKSKGWNMETKGIVTSVVVMLLSAQAYALTVKPVDDKTMVYEFTNKYKSGTSSPFDIKWDCKNPIMTPMCN